MLECMSNYYESKLIRVLDRVKRLKEVGYDSFDISRIVGVPEELIAKHID